MPLPPPVNVGLAPNDGKGDPNRTAFQKTNARDEYLDQRITSVSTLTLASGTTTTLPPGSPATASLRGTSPNYTLDLGLPAGIAGAGAPTSPDILAVAEMARLERALSAAGVPDEASLILDFTRGVHFASKTAITASILTLIAALPGSSFARASTGTYFASDGLLKTAANNVPRLEYDPVSRLPLGLLIENLSRTNLFTRSEELDNAAWSKAAVSVTANATTAPDGLVAADKVYVDATTDFHRLTRNVTLIGATTYGVSAFFKAAEYNFVRLEMFKGTIGASVYLDLTNGATSGSFGFASVAVQSCGNGWYRLRATFISDGTVGVFYAYPAPTNTSLNWAGDGSSGVYMWGFQLEVGDGVSSYIPTVASTATRAADILTLAGGSWLPGTALSALVEFSLNEHKSTSAPAIAQFQGSTTDNYVILRHGTIIGGADLITKAATVSQIDSSSYAIGLFTTTRFAFGIDATSWGFAKDNVISYTGGATTFPSVLNTLLIGADGPMGHIRRVIAWPSRLSNAKTQIASNQAAWN